MAINNTVELIGNLGAEARIIQTEGKTFASFSVATTDSYQDDAGNWQNKATIWHQVMTFNPKLIELVKNLKTGTRIQLIGALSYRAFPVQLDGQTVTKQEATVIARKIEQAPLAKK